MPRKKPLKDIQSETAELLDRTLHRLLKRGGKRVVTGTDSEGRPVVEQVDFDAATLNAILARVRDLGIQSPTAPGTAAGDLVREAARRGITFKGRPVPHPHRGLPARPDSHAPRAPTLAATPSGPEIYVEDTWGGGMYAKLFEPILRRFFVEPCDAFPKGWTCSVIDDKAVTHAVGQKEQRIIDVIEPVPAPTGSSSTPPSPPTSPSSTSSPASPARRDPSSTRTSSTLSPAPSSPGTTPSARTRCLPPASAAANTRTTSSAPSAASLPASPTPKPTPNWTRSKRRF